MITSLAHITFPTHAVHVSRGDDDTIHLFKYDDGACDMAIFSDQYEAADWLLLPPPLLSYRVIVSGDE